MKILLTNENTTYSNMCMNSLNSHIKDLDIHVTKEDKDKLYQLYKKLNGLDVRQALSSKADKSEIPTKLSLLDNDLKQIDLSKYATKQDIKDNNVLIQDNIELSILNQDTKYNNKFVHSSDLDLSKYLTSHQNIKTLTINGVMNKLTGTGNIDINTIVKDNEYTLNTADDVNLGGIKLGYEQNGRNYPVLLDNGKAFVHVPWTDTVSSLDFNANEVTQHIQEIKELVENVKGRISLAEAANVLLNQTVSNLYLNVNENKRTITGVQSYIGDTSSYSTLATLVEDLLTKKVNSAYIIASINNDESDVTIKADKINIDGNAIANKISSTGITIRDNTNTSVAGITGDGENASAVRMWAGKPTQNNDLNTTPFRVTGDGKLTATDAEISGVINATSGKFTGAFGAPYKSDLNTVWQSIYDGLNILITSENYNREIVLSMDKNLDGYECEYLNYSGHLVTISMPANVGYNEHDKPQIYHRNTEIYEVQLLDKCRLRMKAFIRPNSSINGVSWVVLNTLDFDVVSSVGNKYKLIKSKINE